MSATNTALEIIHWVLAVDNTDPPQGDCSQLSTLSRPSPELKEAIQMLTEVTSARLGMGVPVLGVSSCLPINAGLLATALGVRDSKMQAGRLVNAIQYDRGNPAEWVALHALIDPFLTLLSVDEDKGAPSQRDSYLALSPLTAVLTKPLQGQNNSIMTFINKLLTYPQGRRFLQLTWAKPVHDPGIMEWRSEVLGQLRQTEDDNNIDFVIDVYEAHMVHFEEETLGNIEQARHVLVNPSESKQQEKLKQALLVADWWKPLWELKRSRNDELRKRKYLGYKYLEGTKLFNLSVQMKGGVI